MDISLESLAYQLYEELEDAARHAQKIPEGEAKPDPAEVQRQVTSTWELSRPDVKRAMAGALLEVQRLTMELGGLEYEWKNVKAALARNDVGWLEGHRRVKGFARHAHMAQPFRNHCFKMVNVLKGMRDTRLQMVGSFPYIKAYMDNRVEQADREAQAMIREPEQVKPDLARALGELALGDADGWVGAWTLGEGGFGQADLWVRQNNAGSIRDRAVCKITDLPPPSNLNRWNGAMTLPVEVQAMYNLKPLSGADSIVKIRNHKLFRGEGRTVIIMEYCPGGSLSGVLKRHHAMNLVSQRDKLSSLMPEPWLWHVFESLAIAGRLMESGDLNTNAASWAPIIHRDLKLGNVMLGANTSRRFAGYMTPKIGDFGECLLLDMPFKKKSQWLKSQAGTQGNCAPEQCHGHEYDPPSAQPDASSATNVWGIGNIMWSLIEGHEGDQDLIDWYRHANCTSYKHKYCRQHFGGIFSDEITKTFPKELLDLVLDCCQYKPAARPTFDAILDRIRNFNGAKGKLPDYAEGLRSAPLGDNRWAMYALNMPGDTRVSLLSGLPQPELWEYHEKGKKWPPAPPTDPDSDDAQPSGWTDVKDDVPDAEWVDLMDGVERTDGTDRDTRRRRS